MTKDELFRAGRAGDIKARDKFLILYDWIPQKILQRYWGLQDDWEDMLQEGRIGLLSAWERYDEANGVGFSTFAWHRVRGKISSYHRYRRRRQREFKTDSLANFPDMVTSPTQERDAVLSDRHQKLCSAIRHLPRQSRECLSSLLSGKSQHSLAKELGVTRQAVNLHYHAAVEQLREKLHKRDFMN